KFDARYTVVGNDGATFYVLTDNAAGRNRLVAIDLAHPEASAWTTLIAELPGRDVLAGVAMAGDRFLVQVRTDAHERLRAPAQGRSFESGGGAAARCMS